MKFDSLPGPYSIISLGISLVLATGLVSFVGTEAQEPEAQQKVSLKGILPYSTSNTLSSGSTLHSYKLTNRKGFGSATVSAYSAGATFGDIDVLIYDESGSFVATNDQDSSPENVRIVTAAPDLGRPMYVHVVGRVGVSYNLSVTGSGKSDSAKRALLIKKIQQVKRLLRRAKGANRARLKKKMRKLRIQLRAI